MPKPKLPLGVTRRGNSFVYRTNENGRDRKMSLGCDRFLALKKYREIVTGTLRPFEHETVGKAAKLWLEVQVRAHRNPKGFKIAQARVQKYLEPFMGGRRVAEVRPDDLLRYKVWLQGQSIAMQTVAHVLADAKCFFRWCEEAGYVSRAPIPRRLLPKLQEQAPRYLSEEEVQALLNLPDPWRFVIRLGLATGLRWSEMCRAQAAHLSVDGNLTVEQTKSSKLRRIPLGETDPALARETRGRVGKLVEFAESSVGTFNRRVREKTGLEKFSSHQLRHTFATRWLAWGGNIVALQEVLGHSDLKLTQRYARTTEAFVRAEARRQAQAGTATGTDAGTILRLVLE